MKTATPSKEEKRERTERLEAVSAQYWADDLAQLDALEEQWRRDQVPYLRRVALHIGVLVLLASGAPFQTNGRYGRFTAAQLAAELGPYLSPAAQFLERHGYSIIPVPAPLLSLVEKVLGPANGPGSGNIALLELLQRREASAELSEEFTAQYWRDDLDQLRLLDSQRNRELASFLRRAAVYIGTLVLSASGPPHWKTGKFGLYPARDLVAELGPLLAAAFDFQERQGYGVLPVPSALTTLLGLLAWVLQQGAALPPGSLADGGREARPVKAEVEMPGASSGAPREASTRATPGKATRERMRFDQEGTI